MSLDLNQIHHGDCLDLMRHIPDGSVDMILCDLPYGTTQNKWDSIIPLNEMWEAYRRICKGVIVLTAAQPFTSILVCSNLKDFKYQWVWKKSLKTNFLNAKKQPLREHEDILVFAAGTYNPQGLVDGSVSGGNKLTGNYGAWNEGGAKQTKTGYPTSILSVPNPNQGSLHPTQKPVALFEYLIRTYTNPGELVLDNCAGSCTTAVAALNTVRNYICIEQEEKYVNIGRQRVANHQPVLAL